ncbi:hypothetical protein UA45_15480 [Morganella morganii]|uniref:Uncharacterized protein n=1 Tax=Morganella morganii TaxID=582 RepID=A0A0D8L893_MORMO|nr:hypothetical protein UA45_15480 [Morganella morganii]
MVILVHTGTAGSGRSVVFRCKIAQRGVFIIIKQDLNPLFGCHQGFLAGAGQCDTAFKLGQGFFQRQVTRFQTGDDPFKGIE